MDYILLFFILGYVITALSTADNVCAYMYRDRPIMLIFLPIMLCCSVQNFNVLCSILC